jgi:hypothetical protein
MQLNACLSLALIAIWHAERVNDNETPGLVI